MTLAIVIDHELEFRWQEQLRTGVMPFEIDDVMITGETEGQLTVSDGVAPIGESSRLWTGGRDEEASGQRGTCLDRGQWQQARSNENPRGRCVCRTLVRSFVHCN